MILRGIVQDCQLILHKVWDETRAGLWRTSLVKIGVLEFGYRATAYGKKVRDWTTFLVQTIRDIVCRFGL